MTKHLAYFFLGHGVLTTAQLLLRWQRSVSQLFRFQVGVTVFNALFLSNL